MFLDLIFKERIYYGLCKGWHVAFVAQAKIQGYQRLVYAKKTFDGIKLNCTKEMLKCKCYIFYTYKKLFNKNIIYVHVTCKY